MYSAVITAAGVGSRSGLGYNKMLFEYQGITVLERVVKTFVNNPNFDQIIITVNSTDVEAYQQILKGYKVEMVIGGSERMHSVANGIEVATNQFVFVHDGARIFLDDQLISRLIEHKPGYDGLALATQVIDTTLFVEDGHIKRVLNRDNLYNMQTPQVVNKAVYTACYTRALSENKIFTDEMSMLANYGYNCQVVASESYNFKLTKPEDFEV